MTPTIKYSFFTNINEDNGLLTLIDHMITTNNKNGMH